MTGFPGEIELAPRVDRDLLDELRARIAVPEGRPGIEVIAPFTESAMATIPAGTADDARAAVERAREAQRAWAAVPIGDRAAVLSRFHDLLIRSADTALDLVQLEAGKARIPALEEVYDTIATTRYYLKTGPRLLRRQRRAVSFPGFTTSYENRHPHGVLASISPWNFPFTLSISDVIPALLAGNAVVSKPDEKTPFSLLYGVGLLEAAGLPAGVIQVVTGHGEEVGPALVDTADYVMFTGSTEVGRQVSTAAAQRLIGSSMELGGKNAAIVLADADLDRTVPGLARSVFANGGQLCISMERIYIDSGIEAELTERLVEHTRALHMSTEYDFSSELSSMVSREHLENVHAHVEDAVSAGATLLTGGKPRPDVGPLFYAPTLLTDVHEEMQVCRTETFGPVASIYRFDTVNDAVAMANDSEYGLNFSVWTRDTRRGVEIASRLRAGTVGVNDGYAAVWSTYDSPMGGMGSSGLGRRHGVEGLLKYTEAQTVAVQKIGPAFAPPGRMSYEAYQRFLGLVLRLLKHLPFYK